MEITITIVIIIKKQLRDAGTGFNLEDHGIIGSDLYFSTVNKISFLKWFIYP